MGIKKFKSISNGREVLPDFEINIEDNPGLSTDKIDSSISIRNKTEEYITTNVTEDREYDADTVTIAELADILGTLIADLKKNGNIK